MRASRRARAARRGDGGRSRRVKFLLVLLVVLAVLWLLGAPGRRLRGGREGDAPPRQPPPASSQDSIVACPQCGLHLPRSEAIPGRGGFFCSETHRGVHERAHPPV
jgi:uncharacterized protein